ncbi:MAG: UDP-2,4-diacetamido-2,4,6-trideoxy-beta-L-altropyranose hydrolase [Terriglobales bacterium]
MAIEETAKEAMKPGALLIRADASLAIGTGHVMRCLALAQAWQDAGGTASLAVAELPDGLSPRVTTEGVTVSRVRATPGGPKDAAATIALAHRLSADWVVIDGDRFGSDFLETVHAAGFRVLLIDDFADRKSFPADLIVNPDLDDDGDVYRKRGATAKLLIGPPYVLLRREFRQETETREIRHTGKRILVTLGGSDPENLTPKIANALAHCSDLEVTVIAGAGYDKGHELRKLRASNLQVVFNPPNMAQFMKHSDQAIIVAGGTLWELLSMGCAVLSYSRNIMQAHVIQALSHRGAVVDLGETRHFDQAKLVAAVKELVDSRRVRERMRNLGRTLVDGLGATRVVEAARRSGGQGTAVMLPIAPSERDEFLRMAEKHFSEMNPSFVPQEDWKEHYFPTIMANPQYVLRWIVCDRQHAGFILFGLEKHRFLPRMTGVIYEVYVLPEFRRRGVATVCAVEAIRELRTHAPSKIQLEVIEGRVAAAALWESLGFRKVTGRYVLSGSKS